MKKITEIVYGDSLYITMLNSRFSKNKIIKFNTVFSIGDLSGVDDFKIYMPKNIYGKAFVYDFNEQINMLNDSIKNNNKIRVWCSYQDADSYILLTFICNYLKDVKCDLYVIYSDDYDNECQSPAMLRENELETVTNYERKLSNNDRLELSKMWNDIKAKDADIRIMCDNKVKLVSYDYFNDIIINELKFLGEVKRFVLIGKLLSLYHLVDLIFIYLINRLIKHKRIVIVHKGFDSRDDIISIK